MAMKIEPERQRLMEQVLEYWYTADFMNQGSLQTEQTRRDKENYAFAMNHPKQFGSLYRHEFLLEGESILNKINQLEEIINSKRQKEDEQAGINKASAPCCHGRITVYVGSINRAYLSNRIASQLNCDPPSNPSADRLALASFQLSDEGKYVKGSFSLSPILWAVQRIDRRSSGMTMYEVLDPDEYQATQAGYELNEKETTVSYEEIQKIADKIIEETVTAIDADVEDADVLPEIHYCYSIYRNIDERAKRETDDYYGLAMSFYAADLAGFKKAVEEGKWCDNDMWNVLIDYICAPYDMAHGVDQPRKDLSITALRDSSTADKTKAELRKILTVDQTPFGKWPSKYQPFLMQQAAINLAVNTDRPIFAVNGPPGTGKTTLLREIVAENVVQRAFVLAQYDQPDSMFVRGDFRIGSGQYYFYSFRPDMKDIRKYAIVVASSNNAAVENISKQLPLVDAMERNIKESGNQNIEAVRELFSMDHAKIETIKRKNFAKEGQPVESFDLPDIYFSSYASDLMREPCWGLISAPLGKRSNIVSFYRKVIKQMYWDFYRDSYFCKNRIPQYQEARKQFIKQFDVVKKLREDLQKQVAFAESKKQNEAGIGEDHFVCISDELLNHLSSVDNSERKKAQMINPRLSAHYDREREKLFHAALLLTKEFVLSSECCRNNFNLLGMVWGLESYNNVFERASAEEKETAFKKCMASLIQTLQILVPVISTTFASAGRFFRYVNKLDALGTIIVDEAGQATPQMALRLFSKASKAIVVGDPNQIDPVVSDELAFLESTLDQEIGEVYSDKTISVQKIADYLSLYGGMQTDVLGVDSSKWIGVPLYVHSRCIEPMFSISNRLSYGDAMLRITSEPSAEIKETFCYQTSQWINVSGEEEKAKNHFVRTQGERVLQLLETAFAENAKKADPVSREAGPDLFIISPFHTVAEGMRQLLSTSLSGNYPVLAQNREIVENWIIDEQNPHIGTVHTFQGREANEVILLLGCDEYSRKSANWVNRNIVNVAVSRAKYRLYVVGDVKVWNQCDPVMEMKYDLDSYAFDRLAAFAGAASTTEMVDDLDIPELPTSEMFEIEDVSEESPDEEFTIETDSSLENIRAYVPGIGTDFTEDQLQIFGLHSMEEFQTLFSTEVQNLLRTGMWNYLWIKPNADKLPEFYDASSVAICFCKAFELSLKQNYFRGLKLLVPDTAVKGKTLSEIDIGTVMIGDYSTIISLKQSELGAKMTRLGYRDMDTEWWGGLLEKLRQCKDCRNSCCHPGKVYTWKQLESLLTLLFKDSKIPKKGLFGKERIVHGLMLDSDFRKAISKSFGDGDDAYASVAATNQEAKAILAEESAKYVKQYCKVTSRIKLCTIDQTPLIQKTFDVRKKNGQLKKMNMQYCQSCGRRYINVSVLSDTQHIEDYELTAVPVKEWK